MLDEKLSLKKRATIRNNRLIYRRDIIKLSFLFMDIVMILIILLGTLRERMRLITQIDNLYFSFLGQKTRKSIIIIYLSF